MIWNIPTAGIFNTPKPPKVGFFPPCEQYYDCNLPAGNFRSLVPPSQSSASLSLLPADQQGSARDDDCLGFIWFKGECLFSTPNRFMDFPPTDVHSAPAKLSIRCTAIKVIWLLCVTTDLHTIIEPTPLMNIRGAEGVVVQVWAGPWGVALLYIFFG